MVRWEAQLTCFVIGNEQATVISCTLSGSSNFRDNNSRKHRPVKREATMHLSQNWIDYKFLVEAASVQPLQDTNTEEERGSWLFRGS